MNYFFSFPPNSHVTEEQHRQQQSLARGGLCGIGIEWLSNIFILK